MTHPYPLSTPNLVLRTLLAADAKVLHALRSDPAVNRYLERAAPTSISETDDFIQKINEGTAGGKSYYWAIALKNAPALAGTICLWNFSADGRTAEVGFELATAMQGKGIMHEAIRAVIAFSFTGTNLTRILAYTHRENKASIALLLKNDFSLAAGLKDEHNPMHLVYSLEKTS